MNKIATIFCAALLLSGSELFSQGDKEFHHFNRVSLESRSDFDYINNEPVRGADSSEYGFNGKYFNLHVAGEFAGRYSYYFRQRIIAKPGAVSFFDNTDFLWLQYKFNNNWAVRGGKDFLRIGGFEYDAAPIDVYYYTKFWANVACFQLNATLIYDSDDRKNQFGAQVSNSPYVYFDGAGDEWKRGLLGYSLFWNGNYEHFKTLYSVNMFERERGSYVNYIALGNKLEFDSWSLYVDYLNRAADTGDDMFKDFTLVSRLDVKLGKVNLFAKGGYEQNKAEEPGFLMPPKDIMMNPDESYCFYGLGAEYRPNKNVRLHAVVSKAETTEITADETHSSLNFNVGLSFNLDFLQFLTKSLNSENK